MTTRTYCSFCGKNDREVEVILAGAAAAFICNECVDAAVEQVAAKRRELAHDKSIIEAAVRCAGCQPVPLRASEPHLEPAR